ncbi:MAG TPA: PDZ domain-containing protein [Saprospiraceae bacterium]|nr:PDZ domain-containing protein [Saprospiraceae bacterium]
MKNVKLVLATSLLSAFLSVAIYRFFEQPKQIIIKEKIPATYAKYSDDTFVGSAQRKFLASSPTNFISAAKVVTPAVVNIKSSQESDFDFWGSGTYGTSSGSGVIISSDGFIVTNNHVVEEGNHIEVTLNDHREYKATLVGFDKSTDLALLKIDAKKLPNITFGNSDSLSVGEWVLAVGNPFNLESTVTAGIISARGRDINILEDEYSIESFIQTDAAINPGNSGGAMVNTNGELVGINTAIMTRTGKYEGYAFAIPANLVKKVIRDLKEYGVVQRAMLGVGIENVNNHRAKELGLKQIEGVYITRVTKDSGADDANIRIGDVIIKVDGVKTRTIPELQEQVAKFRPGNTIGIEYIRKGKRYKANVTLKNKKNTTSLVNSKSGKILEDLGFEIRDLSDDEKRRLKTKKGVMVKSITRGSKIERTNMDPGFIITKINDIEILSVDSVLDILDSAEGKIMLEGFYENYPGEYYYAFPIK